MKHTHRPTFVEFLLSKKHIWKGLGFRYYKCKKCGCLIQLKKTQRKKYNFLAAIPAIILLFFMIGNAIVNDAHDSSLCSAIGIGLLYIFLCMSSFYVAFHFAKFEVTVETKLPQIIQVASTKTADN